MDLSGTGDRRGSLEATERPGAAVGEGGIACHFGEKLRGLIVLECLFRLEDVDTAVGVGGFVGEPVLADQSRNRREGRGEL